jgi:hypothetical protein
MRQYSRNGERGFEHRGGGPGRQPLGEMGLLRAPIADGEMFAILTSAPVRERFSRSEEPKMLTSRAPEINFVFSPTTAMMEGYATVCASSHVASGTPLLPDLAASGHVPGDGADTEFLAPLAPLAHAGPGVSIATPRVESSPHCVGLPPTSAATHYRSWSTRCKRQEGPKGFGFSLICLLCGDMWT